MALKIILAFVISLGITLAFGKVYIPWLRKQKAGQEIKQNGPVWQQYKAGTPTMGGVMFILALGITISLHGMITHNFLNLVIYIFALFYAAIGFLDDWEKIKNKRNLGIKGWTKFFLQALAAGAFIFLIRKYGLTDHELYVPFVNKSFYVPGWFFYPLLILVIVGTVNSVNITDGIDGLATGTTIPVMLFFVALAFKYGKGYEAFGVFASAMLGGLFGFLWYNKNPAKVFMGDTGSLFLGAVVVALALIYDMPLVLVTLGIVYLIEVLSDIIQVAYFKITHGKRVFKMAPFHHHLEMGGWTGKKWNEKEIFFLFTGISLLFAIISFIGVSGSHGYLS